MKPLEILASFPPWVAVVPETILNSPAFAMPCHIGDGSGTLRLAPVKPAESEMLALSVTFGDEPHRLCLSRSPAFPELDRIWDSRADVPAPLVLALVERECGPLFQFLENAVRRQLKLVGLAADPEDRSGGEMVAFKADEIVFSITGSGTVTSAFGVLRNLDLSHESIRSQTLPAEVEYAAFTLPEADLASLAPGDAVLLPEIDTVSPRLVVGGRFVIDENGVSPYAADARMCVRAAESREVALGDVFDAIDAPKLPPSAQIGAPLRLVRSGRPIATGRLDRLAGQFAFCAEQTS